MFASSADEAGDLDGGATSVSLDDASLEDLCERMKTALDSFLPELRENMNELWFVLLVTCVCIVCNVSLCVSRARGWQQSARQVAGDVVTVTVVVIVRGREEESEREDR